MEPEEVAIDVICCKFELELVQYSIFAILSGEGGMELDTRRSWLEDLGCLLCRASVEVVQPWEASFVATIGVEGVGPEWCCLLVDQVLEQSAVTPLGAGLAVQLEYAEVGKDLTAFDVSHRCAILQRRDDREATNSCLQLKPGKGVRSRKGVARNFALACCGTSLDSLVIDAGAGLIELVRGLSLKLTHAFISGSQILPAPSYSCISLSASAVPSVHLRPTRKCAGIIALAFILAGPAFIRWGCCWSAGGTLRAGITGKRARASLECPSSPSILGYSLF